MSSISSVQMLTKILLSLSTAPLLLLLIGSKALAQFLQDMGQTSEEMFRGDRLPVLRIAPPPKDE